jgi:predicted transcriptional regulator of viral defense system
MSVETAIHSYLDSHSAIDVDTAVDLARAGDRDVPRSTVWWRLHDMVQRGTLQRLRRGVYSMHNLVYETDDGGL